MKMLTILIALAFGANGPVMAKPEDHFSHLPEGGRRSLHGMVLFGAGPYFLEHIPMLTPPHDFQIIAEVSLSDESGKPITRDFSHQGFTLKPSTNFSLNDYVAGRLKKFSGSIHEGSFEQGGQIVPGLRSVTVNVVEYKLIRHLPANAEKSSFRVTDGVSIFDSNIIRPEQNLQDIRNFTTGKQLWCVSGPEFFDPCP
jgi:hypothetical protein